MLLQTLSLTHFRNFLREKIQPGEKINIFWGDNAQGKTNLLEAIYLLSNLKSFRSVKNDELIRHGDKQANISAGIEKQGVSHQISIGLGPAEKNYRVDGKNPQSVGEFLGFFKTVLFAPEEIYLIKSFPAGRRALIDRAVFFTSPEYLQLARDYQRQLKQRNRLLKEKYHPEGLLPWTEGLIKNGARLRRARINYLKRITPLIQHTYASICRGEEEVDIRYKGQEEENQEAILQQEFNDVGEREWRYQQTLAGPHRDDPQFLLKGESLKAFGSQGQQRSFMLAFKCAQVIDLEKKTGETPVLLLDDLGSELDPSRRQAFFEFVQQRDGQVFLTTADISLLKDTIDSSSREFYLEAGIIRENTKKRLV
jgi:DNA replication and repair protein RecF